MKSLPEFLLLLSDDELVQWDNLLEQGWSEAAAQTTLRPHEEVFEKAEVLFLNYGEWPAGRAEIEAITTQPNLRALSLSDCETLRAPDLAPLVHLKKLEVLEIGLLLDHCEIVEGMEWLDSLPHLRRLDISGGPTMTSAGWDALSRCSNLVDLRLCSIYQVDQELWLPSVLALTKLHTLDVSFSKLDDRGLAMLLKALPNLQSLELSETKVSITGTQCLADRKWKRLKHYLLEIDNATLETLKSNGSHLVCFEDADFDFHFPFG